MKLLLLITKWNNPHAHKTPFLPNCWNLASSVSHQPTIIINTSLQLDSFPVAFKTVLVKKLLKKYNLDPNDATNYRPVSNLLFISKFLEKIVLNQLHVHLNTNNLLDKFQSGFRANHALKLLYKSSKCFKNVYWFSSVLFLLEPSAAFDIIHHGILTEHEKQLKAMCVLPLPA